MQKFCILSLILTVSAAASPIGACVTGMLSRSGGNSCALGDKMFDNFAYSGHVMGSDISIDFQMVGTEFHRILAPATAAGFFASLSLTDRVSVLPSVAPNTPSANYQNAGVTYQSNFSAEPGSSGLPDGVNTAGPTDNSAPGSETGDPQLFAGTTTLITTSVLTDPGGAGSANPGLANLVIQADTVVPEPASFGLIGIALVGGGMLRKILN